MDCVECERILREGGHALRGACASVGIERGKSTDQMVREYLAERHEREGHVSVDRS